MINQFKATGSILDEIIFKNIKTIIDITNEGMKINNKIKTFAMTIKHVFLGTPTFRYYSEVLKGQKEREKTGNMWMDYYFGFLEKLKDIKTLVKEYEEILEKVTNMTLPEDLEMIRDMLMIGIKRLKGELNFSDFIEFANRYARLWHFEREKENLEIVIAKIYGADGRADLRIF
ncbi:MAG: hypothetical protein ACPL3A_00380 [Thermoanaerobacteraceae bacterium]